MMDVTAPSARSRWVGFRVVAGVLAVLAFVPSVVFVLGSFTDPAQEIHLVHFISGLAGFGLVLGAAGWVLARRPTDSAAAIRAVVLGAAVAIAGGLLAGDLVSGFWFVAAVFALALLALHPDRTEVTRVRSISVEMLLLGLAALVPAAVFALRQAELQRNGNPALDPHAEFHHYSGMAVFGLLLAAGVIAAAAGGGGRLPIAWSAALGAVIYGAAALVYGDHVGAVDTPWALAMLAWGVAVAIVAELERRRASRQVAAVGQR